MKVIDFNCDLGESFGSKIIGNDEAILAYITSANIACGLHGGDPQVMAKTIRLCIKHGVAIGGHPGFPDLENLGRREMAFSLEEITNLVLYQLGALGALVQAEGGKLQHIKPHGALYNMAAKSTDAAMGVIQAILKFDADLVLYGLSNSALLKEAEKKGIRTVHEVFADRRYNDDGTLVSRSEEGAVLTDREEIGQQALGLINKNRVRTIHGNMISLKGETICLHGDNPNALDLAQYLYKLFQEHNIHMKQIIK